MFETKIEFKTITNFDNGKLPLYNLVVNTYNKKAGENILAISNIAIYGNNNISENSSCLIQLGSDSIHSFWVLFNELQDITNKY